MHRRWAVIYLALLPISSSHGALAETNGERMWRYAQIDAASCASGDVKACDFAGRFYLDHDVPKALDYFGRACSGGVDSGCVSLAFIYHEGSNGVKRDRAKAIGFARRGCELGNQVICDDARAWAGSPQPSQSAAHRSVAKQVDTSDGSISRTASAKALAEKRLRDAVAEDQAAQDRLFEIMKKAHGDH